MPGSVLYILGFSGTTFSDVSYVRDNRIVLVECPVFNVFNLGLRVVGEVLIWVLSQF